MQEQQHLVPQFALQHSQMSNGTANGCVCAANPAEEIPYELVKIESCVDVMRCIAAVMLQKTADLDVNSLTAECLNRSP